MFNTKIVRQHGGSELHVYSGGSLVFDAGATITGNRVESGGSITRESGNLEKFNSGASLSIDAGPSKTVLVFSTGTSLPGLYAGFDVPSFVARAGSIYIRSQGSISGMWTNITQDDSGSSWRAFQQGSAIG